MLSASHDRAYQDFLTLLTEFDYFLLNFDAKTVQTQIISRFEELQTPFADRIATLNSQNIAPDVVGRWQSLQTEIKRDFKLLSTEILFLVSARQDNTREQKIKNIIQYTAKLINYCQIMLRKDKE